MRLIGVLFVQKSCKITSSCEAAKLRLFTSWWSSKNAIFNVSCVRKSLMCDIIRSRNITQLIVDSCEIAGLKIWGVQVSATYVPKKNGIGGWFSVSQAVFDHLSGVIYLKYTSFWARFCVMCWEGVLIQKIRSRATWYLPVFEKVQWFVSQCWDNQKHVSQWWHSFEVIGAFHMIHESNGACHLICDGSKIVPTEFPVSCRLIPQKIIWEDPI